ncbi:uncharacterized protein LOC143746389 [Siphateles boraxobius]|uniref:uncharacterized protein LOC143746389 n=1 Tax=Siphateles boraxobius TaxID=180520 RepID=UPI004062D159
MIRVVVFFLGVLLTINDYNYPAILVYSGITYWGSCIFIIAGSLSVAGQDKLHPSVVKASLGMNVFSAITAGLAILLMSIQLGVISMMDPSLYAEVKTCPEMEASKIISTDRATVVIQVNPQVTQKIVTGVDGQESRGAQPSTALTDFFTAQPKALGTVQIMIGVVLFLLGIVHTIAFDYPVSSVFSGITYWGSIIVSFI